MLKSIPSLIFQGVIRFYQLFISPLLGQNCRHVPTCSQYAMEAVRAHGAFKGLYLTLKRVLRCHPWSNHDFCDPVPPKGKV